MKKFAKKFLDFSYRSPTAFSAVKNIEEILIKNNFEKLDLNNKWKLKKDSKYYITINESSLFAFEIGTTDISKINFKILGSHTDSPSIKIKPNPEIIDNNFMKFNVEIYGSPILNTWLDRPLSLAGKIYTKSENIFNPKSNIININKPLMIIPNVAIHQNREINKGIELNKQLDMLPIISIIKNNFEKNNYLINFLSSELEIKSEEILDFELYLYEYDKGSLIGIEEEFLSASRIDNLASVYTSLIGLLESEKVDGIKVFATFDNEEIGSETKQGADSSILSNMLERLIYSLGGSREDFLISLNKSFMFSIDGAHAVHPNKSFVTDLTNIPKLNEGIVIKYSANFKYSTDSFTSSIIKNLSEENNLKYQYFLNRSDMVGGSTIGPISSKYLPINSIDIGIPMLSMHSIRELCGIEDLTTLKKLIKIFYETK